MERRPKARSLFDRAIVARALGDSFKKLDPRWQARNPVMFVVEVGAAATTIFFVRDVVQPQRHRRASISRSRRGSGSRCSSRTSPKRWPKGAARRKPRRCAARSPTRTRACCATTAREERVPSTSLRKGDRFVVEAGEIIPADGDVLEGAATVDESAITGESAPVIRESGGDRSAVTGGTRVLSDRIVVRVTANPGESFLDRMIALVEGAQRQKTPNEIALSILLAGLTIIFLIAVATLAPFSIYAGAHQSVTVLIALLVCLIPTTIGGLLSAIGIAGMDRVMQRNVLAMSGRAVEAAGDVDTLLLDKTGTITLGNRQAVEIIPADGIDPKDAARIAYLSSLADETPEGRSIVALAQQARRHATAKPGRRDVRAVQRLHAHERARPGRRHEDPQRRAGFGAGVGPRTGRQSVGRALAAGRADRAQRRHAAAAGAQHARARRDLSQRHPQAEHDASASTVCARWGFAPS